MINCDSELCSGCGACEQICPVNAIKLQENNEGFLFPAIDKNKCINCNKCENVCQIGKENKILKNTNRKYFAAYKKNLEERLKCSSGGIADEIAKYITSIGGYLCAAAFKDNELKHIITDNYDDFKYMRGSKYIQSKLGNSFKKIESLLKEDKIVAFIGTPCQVAGLKLYLGKDYKNLYTIDIICHGIPPLKLFNKFLQENNIDNLIGDESIINFRDKRLGWNKPVLSIKNGKNEIYSSSLKENFYSIFFGKNISLRKSCYKCPYSQTKRCSDITVGDYWGIERLVKESDNSAGYSIISVKSNGGGDFTPTKYQKKSSITTIKEKTMLAA